MAIAICGSTSTLFGQAKKPTLMILPSDNWCNPVSYTHLRAHETVLDLVCRLLLEKKKTTKNKHELTKNKAIQNNNKIT